MGPPPMGMRLHSKRPHVDFTIPEDVVAIGDSLIKFIDREVVTLENANKDLLYNERNLYDMSGRFSAPVLELRKQVRMKSAEAGFYTMFGSEELGGGGLDSNASAYIGELINHRYGPDRPLIQTFVLPSPFTNGLTPVLKGLNTDTRALYLDSIASGEKTLCFGLSEPDAGSDVFVMKSRAVKDGSDWILNGTKQWITNAPYADYCMVFAVTDPDLAAQRKGGITGFFVDCKSKGFSVPSVIPIMGHLGAEIGIISMENVRVPDSHRIGELHKGLNIALTGVSAGRLSFASMCVGMSRWALDQTIEYAKVRKTFGQPIGEHQAIQMHLAEIAMEIYAGKTMTQNCAWKVSQGQKAIKETSMVKAYCTEMASRVLDRCINIHGGMGLTNELRLEAAYRFARVLRIPDGTGEIQRRTVAQRLLAGDTDF
jgi:acyl-CoA dehydrogenase